MMLGRINEEKGFLFNVGNIEYIIALCTQTKRNGNVAILLCGSGECITVSNLTKDNSGNYTWDLGYRARNYNDAVNNYMTRITA